MSPAQFVVEKKVPVSVILTIALQTVFLAWWAAKLDARVMSLEDADRRNEIFLAQRVSQTDQKFEALKVERDRLVKIETQLEAMIKTLNRLEQRLDGPTR